MKRRQQQFAETAPTGRSRGRGKSANGGLRGATRSPARSGGGGSARKQAKKRHSQVQSHTSTPFRPLDQNFSHRSVGDEKSALYMDEPTMRVGTDVLETLGKDERDICLLMVDMLSRQSHVTALRIIGSLHQRLDVKRYLDLYGGTYEHSVTPQSVKDLDGRRELMEHLMSAQQALAEVRRPEAEARETARTDFLAANSPAGRSGGAKPNQNGSKIIRKTPAPPRSPAKKEVPHSNLPPNLRHMSYSAVDTTASSENSPGAYSNPPAPVANRPPAPVSAAPVSLWSKQSNAEAPPSSSAEPSAEGTAVPAKVPEAQLHAGGAFAIPAVVPPPASHNVAKYVTLGTSEDEAPEEDWLHESPIVSNSPGNAPASSKKPEAHLTTEPIAQQLNWEAPAKEEKDEGVVVAKEDEENDVHSDSHTDEDYYKKPGDEDDDDEEEEIDDVEDEEEEGVDHSDEDGAGEDNKKTAESAFPWDDI